MTNEPQPATDSSSASSMQDVALSLRSMNEAQLAELFSILRKPPDPGVVSPGGHKGAAENLEVTSAAIDRPLPSSGNARLFSGLAVGVATVLSGAKSVATEKDFWKSSLSNILPWVLALALAPIVVPWSFERDRAAAKPKVSVEYAFLSRQSQAIPREVADAIGRWSGQSFYQAYRQHRQIGGPQPDVAAFILSGARLGPKMYQGLQTEVLAFRKYLEGQQASLSDQKLRLESVPEDELRSFAFDVLDDPSTLDESNARGFLSAAIGAKAVAVRQLQEDLGSVERVLAESAPEIRIRLTLLNRGATDGLVRHHGEIAYRGKSYELKRTAPPSSDADVLAVPVFQTNAADYSAGSVGKIEQDSMVEFWYSFRLSEGTTDPQPDELCKPGELVSVTLYDQNRSEVLGTLECNQE